MQNMKIEILIYVILPSLETIHVHDNLMISSNKRIIVNEKTRIILPRKIQNGSKRKEEMLSTERTSTKWYA